MKYEVGDKVIIVNKRVDGMNKVGYMDCHLGTTMTIKKIIGRHRYYKMLEDGDRWYWKDNMINHQATFILNNTVITKGI